MARVDHTVVLAHDTGQAVGIVGGAGDGSEVVAIGDGVGILTGNAAEVAVVGGTGGIVDAGAIGAEADGTGILADDAADAEVAAVLAALADGAGLQGAARDGAAVAAYHTAYIAVALHHAGLSHDIGDAACVAACDEAGVEVGRVDGGVLQLKIADRAALADGGEEAGVVACAGELQGDGVAVAVKAARKGGGAAADGGGDGEIGHQKVAGAEIGDLGGIADLNGICCQGQNGEETDHQSSCQKQSSHALQDFFHGGFSFVGFIPSRPPEKGGR